MELHGDKTSYGYGAIHSSYQSITWIDYDLIIVRRVLLVHLSGHWRVVLGYWMIAPYQYWRVADLLSSAPTGYWRLALGLP